MTTGALPIRRGLGQTDITGGICMDASGAASVCPGVIPPPATGSGYQQSASGAILVPPGPPPGTPPSWSLTIPGVPGAPSGAAGATGAGGSNLPGPAGQCIFGTGQFAQMLCGAGFWLIAAGLVLAVSLTGGRRRR